MPRSNRHHAPCTQARCNGTSVTSSYPAAWDFATSTSTLPSNATPATSVPTFRADIVYNLTLPVWGTRTLRIPPLLHYAVRGWASK